MHLYNITQNENYATTSISGSTLTITPVAKGDTSVTVKEANGGKTVTINIVAIAKIEVTLSDIPTELQYVGKGNTKEFIATASVEGTWQVTSSDANVTIEQGNDVTGTSNTIAYKGITASTTATTISIQFTPDDTTSYATPDEKTFEVKTTEITASVTEVELFVEGDNGEITLGGINVGNFVISVASKTSIAAATIRNNTTLRIAPKGEGETSVTVTESNGEMSITIDIAVDLAGTSYSIERDGTQITRGGLRSIHRIAKNGETIILQENVTEKPTVAISKNITLNLQTYQITIDHESYGGVRD